MSTLLPDFDVPIGTAFTAFGEAPETPVAEQRYEVLSELGRGGMGVVYRVEDRFLGRQVAMKRARDELPAAVRAQLLREAAVTALLPHPSIPPLYDSGHDDNGLFYTMPILDGITLADWMRSDAFSLSRAIRILRTVVDAVGTAHRVGVVHRDLKPHNVLIGTSGEVWVLDWGVAYDPRDPVHGTFGTEGYQAPELVDGASVDPAIDTFSLGRTLQDILDTAEAPVPVLASIAARATRHAPSLRYANLEALRDDLSAWLDNRPVSAHNYPLSDALLLWVQTHRFGVGLITLSTLAVLGIGATSFVRQQANYRELQSALVDSMVVQALSHHASRDQWAARKVANQVHAVATRPETAAILMELGSPTLEPVATLPIPCRNGSLGPEGVDCDDVLRSPHGEPRTDQPPSTPDAKHISHGVWQSAGNLYRHARDGTWVRLGPSCPTTTVDVAIRPDPDDRGYATVCADGRVRIHDGTDVRIHDVPSAGRVALGSESAWVGRWDARLSAIPLDGGPVRKFEPHVGPIHDVLVADEAVVVRGEFGRTLSLGADGGLLFELPMRVEAIAQIDGSLWSQSEGLLHQWPDTTSLQPYAYDYTAFGGIAEVTPSPDSSQLLIGHGSSMVSLLDLESNESTYYPGMTGRVSKGMYWTAEGRPRIARPREHFNGIPALDELWPDGSRVPVPDSYSARSCASVPQLRLCLMYGTSALKYDHPLDRPVIAVEANGDHIVALCANGSVWRLYPDRSERVAAVPGATRIGANGSHIALAGDGWAGRITTTGQLERYEVPEFRPITVTPSGRGQVVVGGGSGALLVLADGQRRAWLPSAHHRPLVELFVRGDVLYTGSWDGFLRRWDLSAL